MCRGFTCDTCATMRKLITLLALCLASPAAAQSMARMNVVTDASNTVTTGGTSQTVFPASSVRMYVMCQNPITATETLFVNFGAAASTTSGSIELAPGGTISFLGAAVPTTTVTVTAATTGHRFVCKCGAAN